MYETIRIFETCLIKCNVLVDFVFDTANINKLILEVILRSADFGV